MRVAPTTHSGQVLGLIVAVRPPNSDQFTTDDDTMLTEFARQVGLALHNVELDSALQESLDEVRTSGRRAARLTLARIVGGIGCGATADRAQPPRRRPTAPRGAGGERPAGAPARRARPRGSGKILDQLGRGASKRPSSELRALAHGIYPPLLIDRASPKRCARRPARRAADRGRRRRTRAVLARAGGRGLLLLPRGVAERGQARRGTGPWPSCG